MRLPVCSSALLLAALTGAAAGATGPASSWSKPGVSYADYRADALRCGLAGYNMDVSGTEAAHVFRAATSQLEANETDLMNESPARQLDTATTSARIVAGTRPDERFRQVHDDQIDVVAACLRDRGYHRFPLSAAQQRRLSRLPRGSDRRRRFLYGLATDQGGSAAVAPSAR